MNPIIKSQLEKCKVANVPPFDEDTTLIKIPKGSKMVVTPYQVGKYYILELADWILNPSDDSTLADNWNKGVIPKYKYYKCEISQVMGKMIKFVGFGYDMKTDHDTNDMWEGWVPQKGVTLIQEIK